MKLKKATHALYEKLKEAGKLFHGRVTPRGFVSKNKKAEGSKRACRGKKFDD